MNYFIISTLFYYIFFYGRKLTEYCIHKSAIKIQTMVVKISPETVVFPSQPDFTVCTPIYEFPVETLISCPEFPLLHKTLIPPYAALPSQSVKVVYRRSFLSIPYFYLFPFTFRDSRSLVFLFSVLLNLIRSKLDREEIALADYMWSASI